MKSASWCKQHQNGKKSMTGCKWMKYALLSDWSQGVEVFSENIWTSQPQGVNGKASDTLWLLLITLLCAISSRLTFLHLSIPAPPIGTLIPICNSCRNADCISCWVIKLGDSTLTRLHNQWHFPMETTTRLQSICYPNLIEQLTRISVPRFISCALGDMENMSSAQLNNDTHPQAHTHPLVVTRMHAHTCLNPFPSIHIHTCPHGHASLHPQINRFASCLSQELAAFLLVKM